MMCFLAWKKRDVFIGRNDLGNGPAKWVVCYYCPSPHHWAEYGRYSTLYGAVMGAKAFIRLIDDDHRWRQINVGRFA